MRYWCAQAWLPAGVTDRVAIAVDGGRIASVEMGVEPAAGDEVLGGLVLPGARNAHSHAFHRALRGRTHEGGTFWTWRKEMYAVAAALTPALYRKLARAVYAEMVVGGFTGVGEFHYLHHAPGGAPYENHDMERALAGAAGEAGIRLVLLDTCYLRAGVEPGSELSPEQLRFSDGTVAAWRNRHETLRDALAGATRVRLGTAIHSVRAVAAEDLPAFTDVLGREPLHIHLSEQPAENEATLAVHGRTPTGLLTDAGLLAEPGLSAVHATHLSDEDIGALGSARAGIVMCPTTEADLADGIGPARALADAGAVVALGTDQHAAIDPLLEARGLEAGERLATGQRGRFDPVELLHALTTGGARALGEADGDASIAPGAVADYFEVRTGSVRTAGSRGGQVLLAATAADVGAVVIAGEVVARDGVHARLGDVGGLYREVFSELDAAVAAMRNPNDG